MLHSKLIITPAYQNFLAKGFLDYGMSLSIEFENENFDTCFIDVRCQDVEMPGILAKELGKIMNRDVRLDPEFCHEVSKLVKNIKDELNDEDEFEDNFEKCRIKAEEHEHPFFTAKMIRHSDGRFLTSRAYIENRPKGRGDYVKMRFETENAKFGFACARIESNFFLEHACLQMQKMSGDKCIGERIKNALSSANFTGNIKKDGLAITVKNTYFSSKPAQKFNLYEDDWIKSKREIDPGEIFDDDDFKTLKASKSPQDRKDELLESLPDTVDEYPAEEAPSAPKM